MKHLTTQLRLLALAGSALAPLMLSACVSNTLSTTKTQPIQAKLEKEPNYDLVQRAQAVAEIRQKAVSSDSGQLTNAYASADGPNEPLTASASAAKIEQLQQTSEQIDAVEGDAELAANQRRIRELQKQAQTHYGNAVQQIKN